MLKRRSVLYAKIEVTYGTDPTPTTTDAILIENLAWSHEGLRMIDRPSVSGTMATKQQIFGGRLLSVTFSAEIKGSGSAGTAPEIGAVLQACGYSETVSGGVSVTYEPVSTGIESVTLYLYEDGKRIIVTGCRGNVDFTYEAGNVVKGEFTMVGTPAAQTDVSLPTPVLDSTVPVPYIGGSFTVDGYSATLGSFTISSGNTVATPPSVNGAQGYGEIIITGRDINGSLDPEDELVADEDWLGNFTAGSTMAVATGAIGSSAGNILTTTLPAIYYRDLSPGDRDGINTLDISYGAVESSGDDEVTLVFT